MKVLFFELEGWEKPYLENKLPAGHSYEFHTHCAGVDDAGRLSDCDIVSPFIFSQIKKPVLDLAPKVKLITTRSTGFDHVDCAEASRRGISVSNVPEYGSNTVAEHTFALLLALSRKIIPAYARARTGRFSTEGLRGFDLRGKLLGVVGSGNIGLHVIRMALSFGMKVIVYDPFPRQTIADVLGFEYVPIERLLAESDIITLHCPATKDNQHMIRSETLGKMRRGVVLINTARGTLVNTHDLLEALQSGQVSGAGLDVVDGEKLVKEDAALQKDAKREELIAVIETHRLLSREDVIVTPHNAFNSEEAVRRILDTTVANIASFIATGKPQCPVKC